MSTAVYYLTETGQVVNTFGWPEDAVDADFETLVPDGGAYVLDDTIDPDLHYLPGGVKTDRPDFGADDAYDVDADGTVATLFTMPDGTAVTYNGNVFMAGNGYVSVDGDEDGDVLGAGDDYLSFSMGDTDFNFGSDRVGEFEYKIEPDFPYLPVGVTVKTYAV